MIRRRSLAFLPAALLLAHCGPEPKPPAVLTLTISGSADQNPDIADAPAPIAIRIYQLTATAKFERGDVFALTEREQQTLGTDSAGSQEFVIAPNENRTLKFELKPMVQAIGVVALYRNIDAAQWRADAAVATSGPTALTLKIAKLAISLKPG
ncbi:MAG: type VI secretion system lipoprotein TssJ [Rhodospirillales bacterium]